MAGSRPVRVAILYLASRMPDESVVTRGGIILP